MPLTGREIRSQFLKFFEARGHSVVPSASLVPHLDPTLMFVNAGMVPFKRVFTGDEKRPYSRATSSQKSMRVSGKHNDLENVGRTPRHHTFFEMLGNFSFGDYFKEQAIEFAWELLTEEYKIPSQNLVVSVFEDDDDAFALWRDRIGLPEERIYRLGEAENFWSMGDTGPCGPCSEIHYDRTPDAGYDKDDPSSETGRFLEIWNLVFMQFDRDASGHMTLLPQPCVDTGAGLERLAAVLQGVETNYDTDLFVPILERAQGISGISLGEDPEKDVSLRVVADHARALSFLIGDGILPSNEGRGYVLRRILRRASRHGVLLGLERPFVYQVADAVIDEMASAYPELSERRPFICDRIRREEERFLETLTRGLSLLEGEVEELRAKGEAVFPGEAAFRLYDTFGFPVDLTEDIVSGHGMQLDHDGFSSSMQGQRERARAAWKGSGDSAAEKIYDRIAADVQCEFCGYDTLESNSSIEAILIDGASVQMASTGDEVEIVTTTTPFYAESGGQVGDRGSISSTAGEVRISDTKKPTEGLVVHRGRVESGEIRVEADVHLAVDEISRSATVRNHSGTHLMHAALRQVVGLQAMQKGSLVSPDRLRFDFTHDAPLTNAEIEEIEDLVNGWIVRNLRGDTQLMAYRDALESGAVAIFEEKYGDEVRVLSFGDVSTELCGGTHANATGEIGLLKIVSESGIAAGIRRIEAVTGLAALQYVREQSRSLKRTASLLKSPPEEVPSRVEKLLEDRRAAQKQLEELKKAQRTEAAGDLLAEAREISGGKALATRVDGIDSKVMRGMIDDLRNRLGQGVVMLVSETNGKVLVAIGVTKDLMDTYKAGDLVRETAGVLGGGGGGRPDFAQAGGRDASQIDAAIARFYEIVSAH